MLEKCFKEKSNITVKLFDYYLIIIALAQMSHTINDPEFKALQQ